MKETTIKLLSLISDISGKSAYNIREDSKCAGKQSTENIDIIPKEGGTGIEIRVKPGTEGETAYIPACVTHGGVDDTAYNDFYIGENCDITVSAGCGVHNEDESHASHHGIHRFFIEKNSRVTYIEKHIGTGDGKGGREINTETQISLGEGAVLVYKTSQIEGIDSTVRITKAQLAAGARLIIEEKLMTHGSQRAVSEFTVDMDGSDCRVDLSSRAVAKGQSHQLFRSCLNGNTRCKGHSECDAIIMDGAQVEAVPSLLAGNVDASLIHEAAIGKISGEQIIKLQTMGLTEKEAESRIIEGFLM